jgi:predicted TIM-barrel fold metal-dependent hydrolase
MKIDIHFHALGNGKDICDADNDVFKNFEDNHHWFVRLLHHSLEGELKELGIDADQDGRMTTDEYFLLVYNIFKKSKEIDGAVLLAMDAVFDPDEGYLDCWKTDIYITNTFLFNKINELNEQLQNDPEVTNPNKKFYLGASVSPNRKNWEDELNIVFNMTDAVLIKWLPSAQHISVNDTKHIEFFQALADNNMPLLTHVGPEYSFPEGRRKKHLDKFQDLELPLDHGVKVIGAHCSSPVFPICDRNDTWRFYDFVEQANQGGEMKLWADDSALTIWTRMGIIGKIAKNFDPKYLVHGSDFPLPFENWPHHYFLHRSISKDEYEQIKQETNPLDKDVKIKRAYGFSDTILENAASVLRLA